jgi:starvation-inducible outer membrane lipoprotein
VLNHEERHSGFPYPLQKADDLINLRRIQSSHSLIQQQEFRLGGQCRREAEALAIDYR